MFLNAIFDWGQSWRLISLLIHQNKLRYCVDLHWDSRKAAEQTTLHHTHFSQTILPSVKHLLTCALQSHTCTPFPSPSLTPLTLSLLSPASLCCFRFLSALVFHAMSMNVQLHFQLTFLSMCAATRHRAGNYTGLSPNEEKRTLQVHFGR